MEQKSSNNQRKHVIRIKRCKDRFTHARELFREIRTLNVFQLNILNSLVLCIKSNLKQHQNISTQVP